VVEVKFDLLYDLQCSSWLLVKKNDFCKGFNLVMFESVCLLCAWCCVLTKAYPGVTIRALLNNKWF